MIAIKARDVIGPLVDDDLITCRNGCNSDGVSNWCISRAHGHHWVSLSFSFHNETVEVKLAPPLHPINSLLSFVNPAISGLSYLRPLNTILTMSPRPPIPFNHTPKTRSNGSASPLPIDRQSPTQTMCSYLNTLSPLTPQPPPICQSHIRPRGLYSRLPLPPLHLHSLPHP